MVAAKTSQKLFEKTKMLIVGTQGIDALEFGHLLDYLSSGDLLVVNRAGTLPSSLKGKIIRSNENIEIRLASLTDDNVLNIRHYSDNVRFSQWIGISFGSGDWRTPTENRGQAPKIVIGDKIVFNQNLSAMVQNVVKERLIYLDFIGQNILRDIYNLGRPIQYSYHQEPLEIWDQQTIFSGPPISVEPASAGFAMSWEMLKELKRKGIEIAMVTHAAGLSSTGSQELDLLFPLKEYFEVPGETVRAILTAKSRGRRVIAVGTTVVRALESAVKNGELSATSGLTDLRISPARKITTATSILTGMHDLESSHRKLLGAFCTEEQLAKAYAIAEEQNFRGHEYGDLSLCDCG